MWARRARAAFDPLPIVYGVVGRVLSFLRFFRELGWQFIGVLGLTFLLVGGVEFVVDQIRFRGLGEIGAMLLSSPGSAYADLRTLVPTVAGIVLGLYFTALATVIQSRYERVPAPLTDLVARDRVGNQYVLLLAVAIGVSVLEMVFEAMGRTPSRIHLLLLGIVGALALFGFANIGRRAFSFLDPSRLITRVIEDLFAAVRAVMTTNRHWQDRMSQERARARGEEAAELAVMVVELMQESPNANAARAVARVYQKLVEALRGYLRAKWNIPTQSRWFGRTPRHRRWYFTGVTQLDLALATQTTIEPEAVPDDEWLERDLTEALLRSVTQLAQARNLRDLVTSLSLWAPLMGDIGAAMQVDSGMELSKRLESVVGEAVTIGGAETVDLTLTMACVDLSALARIDLMLGFGNRIRGLDVKKLQEAIAAADWSKPATPDLLGLPREARREAEDLQRKVAFETKVEGERVTPSWYIAELVGFELSKVIARTFTALIARSAETIPGASSVTAVVAVADATRVSRRLEECSKLEALVSVVDERLRSLAELNRSRDYTWATWDSQSWTSTLDAARRLSHRAFARLILPLAGVATDERLPDLLGEAVTKTGEAALLAIVREEHDQLKELFRPYFIGCLAVAERMRTERAIDDATRHAVLFTEALVDLMSVSGYALLYAELTGTRTSWSEIETAWQKWIGENPERLGMLVSSIALRTGGLYGYTPRYWHRSSWDQLVREDLHRRAREGADVRRHESALVRIGYRSGLFADGAHIFSAAFLRAQTKAADLDFGRDPFYESYERELERGASTQLDNDWPDDLDLGEHTDA
jgi:hypothetical protein